MAKIKTVGMSTGRWHGLVRFFHWGTVVLLVITWLMINLHERADPQYIYINLHKAFGVVFLLWVVARINMRIIHRKNNPPAVDGPRWQQITAQLVHGGLYVLLLLMPLCGFLMSQYAGRPIHLFGLTTIPVFVEPNEVLAGRFHDLHTEVIWPLLGTLVTLHILAALYHQFFKHDRTINRML